MIRKKRAKEELTIDLTGPNGNAYFLRGTASKVAKQIGLDESAILEEMKAGDYENLVKVFDKYFGNIFTLLR